MKKALLAIAIIVVLAIGGFGIFTLEGHRNTAANSNTHTPKQPQQKPAASATPQPDFDKTKYSLTDPTSLWVIVNKQRPLQPKTYVPTDLVVPDIQLRSNITGDERQVRQVTADALKTMSDAAHQDGLTLTLESGYRSYNFQVNLYNHYVAVQGKAVADTQSARPGFSEHQTGLAADLGGHYQAKL